MCSQGLNLIKLIILSMKLLSETGIFVLLQVCDWNHQQFDAPDLIYMKLPVVLSTVAFVPSVQMSKFKFVFLKQMRIK